MKILIIFLLVNLNAYTQSVIRQSINYTPHDFFHGLEYGKKINSIELFSGFEYGVVRTIFQSRFFPKLKVGFSFYLMDKEKFQILPMIQGAIYHLKFSQIPKATATFLDVNAGVRWQYGKIWKIGQTLLMGGSWERKYNTIYQQNQTHGKLSYVLQIDCSYAF